MIDSLPERIRVKIWPEPMSGCWLWGGALDGHGYGVARWRDRLEKAHRIVAEEVFGQRPTLCVLHRCDNRACCNPDHLFLGTQAENMADMARKGRAASGDRNGSRKVQMPRGSAQGNSKLTESQVIRIRKLLDRGFRQREIAEEFGVCRSLVCHIGKRRVWRHV